jgi:hypothetical protein
VVTPQFGDAKGALTSPTGIAWPLVIAALALELDSLASCSALMKIVLARTRPDYLTLLRIDLTDFGVNHVVPEGGVTSGALRLRLFTLVGIPAAAGFTTATIEIAGSNLVLGGIFGIGVTLSVSSFSGNVLYAVAAGAVFALLVGTWVAFWMLVRHTDVAVRWVRAGARHVPFVTEVGAEAFVRVTALQTKNLGKDQRRVAYGVVFAFANWLIDAAALWVLFAADPRRIRDRGRSHGARICRIRGASIDRCPGVIGWCLLEYWMPMPLSVVEYPSLRLGPLRPTERESAKTR